MGKIVQKNLPCLSPECGSHDARQLYEDGTSFCFSCRSFFKGEAVMGSPSPSPQPKVSQANRGPSLSDIAEFSIRGFKERGITKVICEFFGVRCSYNSEGIMDAHYYPYRVGDEYSYKVRKLPKEFFWSGAAGSIFGIDRFTSGGKRIIITEGEIDALSVAQASMDKYEKIYPVIALPGASFTNKLLEIREWIRGFDEVVLCMDSDEPGQEAQNKAMKIIGIDKAKIVKMPEDCKDANDVLVKHGAMKLMTLIWDAQHWSPVGIVKKEELWGRMTEYNKKSSTPYPDCLKGVNRKLKGRRKGEITLFISGTGSGKSSLMREIMLNTLETTNEKIGIVSLEESPEETARKLSGMMINRNPANEEISIEDLKVGFDKVFGEDRVILLDHQGSIKDDSVMNQLEYMALMGCSEIYIDHITILVSEGAEGLTGNEAVDKIMNGLLRLVKRHDVWVGLISHLRKAPTGGKSFESGILPGIDDIKGSGSVKQISFDIVAFSRNLTAEDEQERNTITMAVLKSRYTGLTGIVPGAFYDQTTGRLTAIEDRVVEKFNVESP